jgi:hypothetical protein
VDSRAQAGAVLGVLAAAGAALYLHRTGRVSAPSLTAQSTGQSFSPFVFWMHQSPMEFFHQYPDVVGATCLPQPYQTQDVSLSLNHVEVVDSAGCAQ